MVRYSNSITTAKLVNLALSEPDQSYEVNRGEETVRVVITFAGVVIWFHNERQTTEAGAAEVLARWAVEGN